MKTTKLVLTTLLLGLAACGPQSQTYSEALDADTSVGIIGGVAVQPNDAVAKSTVGIATGMHGVFCSGVLVAKNLVFTAGHCTGVTARPHQLQIVFGTDLKGRTEKRKVLGGKVHPNWPKLTPEQEKNWGDIAVLKFEGEAPAGFVPASILSSNAKLKNGMDIVLAGYGLTKMNPDIDPEKLMKVGVKLSDAKYSETEVLFKQHQGKGACHGDSGGPAFATINGKMVLVGITSRSATLAGGSTCLEGSIYSSVPGHISFLKSAAKYLNSAQFVPNEPLPQPEGM